MTAHRSQPHGGPHAGPADIPSTSGQSSEPRDLLFEAASTLGVVAEHVEARARRRQQNDARRLREVEGDRHGFFEGTRGVNVDRIRQGLTHKRAGFADGDDRLRACGERYHATLAGRRP